MTCYFSVFHCRRAPLLGLVCFVFFTEFVHRLWIGELSAICVLHSKTNGFNVFSICANSNLPVDVFKDRHRFMFLHCVFMIFTVVQRSRIQNVFGIDFQMVSGMVLASILHILEVWTPKKSIPKQR